MGFPTLDATERLALAMLAAGADGLELGVPFSDPVADGVTLQRASERALSNSATLAWTLETAGRLRQKTDAPLIAMSYFNPLHRYGVEALARDAAAAGIDGFIVPDLPFAEGAGLRTAAAASGLRVIQLIAPTSTEERLRELGRTAEGFVYCVSLLGTTGARSELSDRIPALVAGVRAHTSTPLAIGFGISRPEHVAGLKGIADACIVGGAVADLIDSTAPAELESALGAYVASLRAAC
jgi:tryptophan synthase alpha chain